MCIDFKTIWPWAILACFGPLIGYIGDALFVPPDASRDVLGMVLFAAWSGPCVLAAIRAQVIIDETERAKRRGGCE